MGLFDGTVLERSVLCERCGKDVKLCECAPIDTLPSKQSLKVQIEKRKRGKLVTVITGFSCSNAQLQETLSLLKNKCGAGGSVDDLTIELQGDHTSRVPALLEAQGYRMAKGK